MSHPIAFWKGVRLWQFASTLRATPSGQSQGKAGASRRRGRLDNRGPSWLYTLSVVSWIPTLGGDHASAKSQFAGRGKQVTRQVYSAKTLELFIDNSALDKGLGQVAWVEDADNYRTVTGAHAGGSAAVVTTSAAPSAWEPGVGDLIVVANPSTGEGFATACTGYSAGSVQFDAFRYTNDRNQSDGEPVTEAQPIAASGWRIYDCAYYYDKAKFLQMVDPPPGSSGVDRWSANITYTFMSETGIIIPSSYTLDFT